MEKFYDENTKFLPDIILTIEEIKFTDLNSPNITEEEKEKLSIVITKLVQNEWIQYSEQDFKNNLVILFKNFDYNIKLINNLYGIFKDLNYFTKTDKEKQNKFNDKSLKPIIFINKKFYTNQDEANKDETASSDFVLINNNENISKKLLSEYFDERKNILSNNYDVVQNQLYNLEKPFEDDNDIIKRLELQNYISSYDRDAITSCVFENSEGGNYKSNDYQCVNLNNLPINIETFRILSPKSITFDKTTIDLYTGDNVKIIGYINKIPSIYHGSNPDKVPISKTPPAEDLIKPPEYKTFNIDKYFEDVDNLEESDKIVIYFNIKLDKLKLNGKIKSIKNNLINIKLDEKIKIENISTNTLTYDKNSLNNDFYIYRINNEKLNLDDIYYKNMLEDTIIAFKFSKENFDKANKFILPNIYQLVSYYSNFINYGNIKEILSKYYYDFDNLDENDLSLINTILEKNVTEIENKTKYKLTKKIFDFKNVDKEKLDKEELSLINFDNLNENYVDYLDFIEDNEENRYKFLTSNFDLGYIHFLNKLKLKIEEDYKEIKDYSFDDEIAKFKKEKKELEKELEKLKEKNKCKQIQIQKIYYNSEEFNKDGASDKSNLKYNNKYVVLVDDTISSSNSVSTLFKMSNGKWDKLRLIDDKNEIKICDGKYYYEQINSKQDNNCIYDNIENLCKKRDTIKLENNLEIIKNQIIFTNDIKDFKLNYKKNIESINRLINKLKYITNNEFGFKQMYYKKKKIQNKYAGNEDYVDFSEQFNNIDNISIGTFNPLITQTNEIINPYKDEKNFLLLEKILNQIGIELNFSEKLYIYESIDFLTNTLFTLKIQDMKFKSKKLTINKIIQKMKDDGKYYAEKEKLNLLVISALITIIIQIQFPNVTIIKLNSQCSDLFSIDGFPRDADEGDKQLYKYIICVINNENRFTFNNEPFKKIIKFILKNKSFLKDSLENKVILQKTSQIDDTNKIWNGFKPELNMSQKPLDLLSKYLYDINNVISNSKIINFNIFKKPLLSNICCLEMLNSKINYYNLINKNIDKTSYENLLKSNASNILINKININIIKKNLVPNFDNNNIFKEKHVIKSQSKSHKLEDDPTEYYDFNSKFLKIFNNQSNIQIKNDENLKDVIKNIHKDNTWFKLSTNISNIFDNIIEFTTKNMKSTTLLTNDVIEDLRIYFITLEDLEEMYYLKRILQKFITTNIATIISKIKNNSKINNFNNKQITKNSEDNDILKIKEKDTTNIFIKDYVEYLDIFKDFNFKKILNNVNCMVLDINMPDNNTHSAEKSDIDNLTKNIYLLNYIFLNIILYIFSSLIYKKPTKFDNERLLNDIDEITSNDISNDISIVSDIVAFILTEFRNTIKNNLISKEKLQSKMDKLREERKNYKLNKYQQLDMEEADTLKILKDVVGIQYDYEAMKSSTELDNGIDERDQDTQEIANQQEENANYTEYIDEYKGENADENDDE